MLKMRQSPGAPASGACRGVIACFQARMGPRIKVGPSFRVEDVTFEFIFVFVRNDNRELCENYLKTFARVFMVL